MTLARMKPRSKSLWILPAACGALVPLRMVHARHSPLAVGQEGDQAQQVVAGGDEVVQTTGFNAHFSQEKPSFPRGSSRRYPPRSWRRWECSVRPLLGGACGHQRDILVVFDALHQVVLAHVAGVQHRLSAQQAHLVQHGLLLGITLVKIEAAGRLACAQVIGQLLQPCGFGGSTLCCCRSWRPLPCGLRGSAPPQGRTGSARSRWHRCRQWGPRPRPWKHPPPHG